MKKRVSELSNESGYLVYFVEDLQRSFETINSFVNNDIWYFRLQLPSIATRHHFFVLKCLCTLSTLLKCCF